MYQYFVQIMKHKYYVFKYGLKTKAPIWRLIIHDWSKFTPSEYPHYQRQFFGKADDPDGFERAWLSHQNRNPHHFEYWVLRSTKSGNKNKYNCPIDMPEWAVREMVADWVSASKVYSGIEVEFSDWTWFNNNYESKIKPNITTNTHLLIHKVLMELVGEDIKTKNNRV